MENERLVLADSIIRAMDKRKMSFIVKGSVLLNYLMDYAGNPSKLHRVIEDLNIDYTGNKEDNLVEAFKSIGEELGFEIVPNSLSEDSATFYLLDKITKRVIFPIRLDYRKHDDYAVYKYKTVVENETECGFYGYSEYRLLADKLCSISSEQAYVRTKDIVDIHILSFMMPYKYISQTSSVLRGENYGYKLGDFKDFKENKDKIKKSFDINGCTIEKLDFEEVYNRVAKFIGPFMKGR